MILDLNYCHAGFAIRVTLFAVITPIQGNQTFLIVLIVKNGF